MNRDTIQLQITGDASMECRGCSAAVETMLSEVRGVQQVMADHETQRIEIITNRELANDQELLSALHELGYQAARAR